MNRITRTKSRVDGANYLIYPSDMKSDTTPDNGSADIPGQDRIEFGLYQYRTKPKSENVNPNFIGPVLPSETTTLFPDTLNRRNEKTQYSEANIFISELYGNGANISKVFLPIQDKIQDQNSVEWNPGELNDFQRRFANLSYSGMTGSFNPGDNIAAGNEFLNQNKDVKKYLQAWAVGEAIGVQNLFTRATGNILNPNLELLFSKPTLRPFTFNFKLSPRNEDDAIFVKAIIKFFKMGMAPRINDESTLFIKSPYIFGIKYLLGDKKPHPGLNLIKKCALTNCIVDYTPNNSYMTYRDGTMTSYNINMTFQELVPVYDKDYIEDKDFGTINHPIGY